MNVSLKILSTLAVATMSLTLFSSPATSGARTQPEDARVPRTVLDVSDLPTGAPPAISWSEKKGSNTVVHKADGSTATVVGQVLGLAPMGSGHVVQLRDGARRPLTTWVSAGGVRGPRSWRSGYGLAASPRGGAVAFTVRRGGIRVIDSEGDRVVRMPSLPLRGFGQVSAVTAEDCVEDTDSNGCSVIANSQGRTLRSWAVSSHGPVSRMPFLRATTMRGRWTGGLTSVSDTGTCSKMVRNQRTKWRTCRNVLDDIAPGGQHLLGTPAYGDGFGPMGLDVLTKRDGSRVRRWTSSNDGRSATYFDQVWEDADHVLVVTFQADEWAVVRLGLDGTMEYAVAPRRGSDMVTPFHLQSR